jgi:hypothetical protein
MSAAAEARTVTGKVLTPDGETIKGAVVQIKNIPTLQSDPSYRRTTAPTPSLG